MKHLFLFLFMTFSPWIFSYAFAADSTSSSKPGQGSSIPVSLYELDHVSGRPADRESEKTITHNSISFSSIINADIKPNEPFNTGLNYPMLGSLGAALTGSGFVMHNYMEDAWWKQKEKFYFSNDYWSKLSNFNKFSHFYSVNLLGHLFSGAYEASGMQALGSTWYSSLSALAYMSYIELENGFHKNNGFSLSNFSADILGTAFYIGQYYIPEMKSLMPKVSFKPVKRQNNVGSIIFDDYAGQKYWMSLRIKEFLPEKVSAFWPSFIMIAAGAGLKYDGNSRNLGGPMEFYFALDLDAEKLPLYGPFWQFAKNTLNYIHFPMPGVRVTPQSAFLMFCF